MSNKNSLFPYDNLNRKSKNKVQEKEDKNINKNIGPYKIISKIKEGDNSKIYLAKSNYTGDEVAIKAISKEEFQKDIEDLTLISNQIESLKILKHKNIISLYEVYESPKYIYLIMEFSPKKNLIEKIILKKRLSENETLIIFVQLLDALVYMHKMNIVHRNIRTEHILFDKNNRPKLIGFNYSTFYEKNKKIKGMFGSLCYTCPEILNDEEYIPEMADVWSLGAVLYVMICGYLPFSEENDEKNKDLISEGKIEYPKEISNKVKDLLKHMLDINCNKRYNFQKIMKHPWVKKYTENKNMFIGGLNIFEIKYPVDERILNIIEKYFANSFNKEEIIKDLIENKYNEGTGLYKLLLKKIIDLKINSVSDLFCEQFIKYIQNKENYYNSNDSTRLYKKYMDKINNKITKIINFIEKHRNKEQNIIDYLLSFEQLKQSKKNNHNDNESIDKDVNTNSDNRTNSITSNINVNSNGNELRFSFQSNKLNNDVNNNDNNKSRNTKKNEIKEEELDISDIDVIKKFQEEQDRQNFENGIIMNKNQKENILKSLFAEKTVDSNSEKNILNSTSNSKANNINSIKSITPESSIFINNLLKEKEKEKEKDNKFKDSLIYSIRKKPTNKASLRKSHIDRGSLLDSLLKKNHPENIRKTLMRYSLFSNISEEEGDDEKNNDKKLVDIENDDNGNNDKLKRLKYSLSFMDDVDEEEESQFNESSYISRNDTRFISEIKDALKELKDLKKADKEKEKQKEKEKMKQKDKNEEEINDYHNNKKSNLKINKEKNKKNVHFSPFSEYNKFKDNDNDNNLKKENVNNFIIKTKNNSRKVSEDKNKNGNNFIIFEGSDFSFHDEMDEDDVEKQKEKERGKKPLREDIISKKAETDICEYRNDKKVISKLDKNLDNKEISICNIDNLRQKIYLFTFKFDKFNSNKINLESISLKEDMIENNLKLFYEKKNNSLLLKNNNRFQYNENKTTNKNNELNINNKRESYDLFENLNNDQNNQNSIVKYNESILNRSNYNLQSEPNVNSNNNSYISNNNNNSIINDNNHYFLYDNNFMTNNEDDDSSFKNKDSVKDPSLDFSSIKKYYKKGILKDTDDQEKYNNSNNDLVKRINVIKLLSENLKNQNEKRYMNKKPPKVYDNELFNTSYKKTEKSPGNRKNNFKTTISPIIKTSNYYDEKPFISKTYLTTTAKNSKNVYFVYDRNRNRNLSIENNPKNYFYISKAKSEKGSSSKRKDKSNLIEYSEKHCKNSNNSNNRKNIKYNSHHKLNLYNLNNVNNYNTINNFEIKNKNFKKKNEITPIKLYKKKHARYCSQNTDRINYSKMKNDVINTEPNRSNINNSSYDRKRNKLSSKKTPNKTIKTSKKSKTNKINTIRNEKLCKTQKNRSTKKIKFSSNTNSNLTLKGTSNKIKRNNNITQKVKEIKPIKRTNNDKINKNKNIVHKKVELNKKNKNNIENMLSKRKEIVRRIRNCKKFLNNIHLNEKYYTTTQTNKRYLSTIINDSNNSFEMSFQKKEINNNNNSPKHTKVLSDILSDTNIFNTETDTNNNNNKKRNIDYKKKTKSYNSSPRNYLIYINKNGLLEINADPNFKNKSMKYNYDMKTHGVECGSKNFYNNNYNNISINSSSLSQENIYNNNKRQFSDDNNSNKLGFNSSSIRKSPDYTDGFINLEEIS